MAGVVGKQRLHATEDGRGDFAVELLIDDGLQQRLEDALRGFHLQAALAGLGDDARQLAVDARQVREGGGVVEFLGHGCSS